MHVKTALFYVFLVVLLSACNASRILVSKGRTQFGKIKFYHVYNKQDSSKSFYYADIDSFGVKYFYSFCRKDILKTRENDKNSYYSVFSGGRFAHGNLPMMVNSDFENPDIFQKFSTIDSVVFLKAEKSIKLSSITTVNWQDERGFIIEFVYNHGWPKGAKFKPLGSPN